jgi:hypothetical protein
MKAWIRTKIIGSGTSNDPRRPYTANQVVNFSIIELANNECLCRISGTPAQIDTIKTYIEIIILSDDEARAIIKTKYPNSDLESLDVVDPEVDEIAKAYGLDPKIRADIQIPSRIGKPLLQEQEHHLLKIISEKIGLTRPVWDKIFMMKYNKLGIEIEDRMLKGRVEDHERILSEIRARVSK